MILQTIRPLFLGLVLSSISEASNSTFTNGTSEYASADRTKRSAGQTETGVCMPYQVLFPNGYCKDIIGYLPVYGTDKHDLRRNEKKMFRYRETINHLIKNKALDVRQTCLEMVDDVYCHHYFKRCYISSRPPLICREACEELFSKACDREYKKVQDLGYNFDIINCTTLPSRNRSSHCYYPDKIRDQLDVLKSEDCYYGDGRGYRGNSSVTVSGYICQSWNAQRPHKHDINGTIYKSVEDSGNLCRNPGGYALEGPWCFTTNRSVRWEYCDVPKCIKQPPSGPPANFRGHSTNSTSINVKWGYVPKLRIHGVLLGFHLTCKRLNTSDRHFVDLSPAEHTWVFIGLHIYRNYSCRLRAYNNYGNGTWSKELVISTDEDVPDRPPKDITAVSTGKDTVQVDWSPVPLEYTNGEILGYKVFYSVANDTSRTNSSLVSARETHLKVKGLTANTNYSFQILAFTAKGNGVKSMAYFARTFTDQTRKNTVDPSINPGEVHSTRDPTKKNTVDRSISPGEVHSARDPTKKSTVDPSISPREVHSVRVSIIVVAVVSGIVPFGAVFLVTYFVRKKRISSNSDNEERVMLADQPEVQEATHNDTSL